MKPLPPKNTATRFAGKGALLFLVKLLPAGAVLVVMWLYAHRLDLNTFGHYQNFWIRYNLLSTFTSLGLPTYVLLLSRDEAQSLPELFRKRLLWIFLGCCALAGGLFGWWERSILPLWLPAAFLLVWTLGLLLEAGLVALRAYKPVLLANTMYTVAFLGLHVWALHRTPFLIQIFGLLLGLGGLKVVAYAVFFRKLTFRKKEVAAFEPDRKTWLHIGANDIIQQSFKVVDKFLVSFLSTPALSAIYFTGAQELPFLSLLLGAVSTAFMQQVGARKSPDPAHTILWIGYTSELLAAVIFPLFCFLMFCRYDLIYWMFTPRFGASVAILTIANYCILFRAYPFTAMLLHLRGGKWVSSGSVAHLLLAAALAFPLYGFLGLKGIILSILIADIALGLFYVVKMRQLSGLRINQLMPLRRWGIQALLSGTLLYGWYRLLLLVPVTQGQRLLLHSLGSGAVAAGLLAFALYRARRNSPIPAEPTA